MNTFEPKLYNRWFNSKHLHNLKKIGKDLLLPDISPREHRLFIQKPSLVRIFPKPRLNMQSYKEIIERSLPHYQNSNPDIENKLTIKSPQTQKPILSLRTIKTDQTQFRISTFRRFLSTKPLKSKPKKNRLDLRKNSLIESKISANYQIVTSRIREISPRKIHYGSDSDEDKIDSLIEMHYIDN